MDKADLIELRTQQLMLENLLGTTELFSVCCSIVQPTFFSPEFRSAVEFIKEYFDAYDNIPTVDMVNAEVGTDLEARSKLPGDQLDYFTDKIELFCRERAVFNEIMTYPQLAETHNYGELLERITAATQLSIPRDIGTDVLSNVKQRIADRQDSARKYSTGWAMVDETMGGGISKTELIMFSANSGGGKSVALSNLALALVKQHLNVLYISLELSEELIGDRFETMITGWNRATKLDRSDETAIKVENVKTQSNSTIYVKYMPADETCCNDIKAYLKQFEIQNGFMPDALIVDYLDILETNEKRAYSNEYQKDKRTSTQLRTIGNNPRHPMIMATASQQNRGAINELDPGQNHIAGGLSKVNICDVYISIIMTDAMRLQKMAFFKFLKIRSSGGVGTKVPLLWDGATIHFITSDSPVEMEPVDNTLKRDPYKNQGKTSEKNVMQDDLMNLLQMD